MPVPKKSDILVAGGGVVGIVTAISLKKRFPEFAVGLVTNTDPFAEPPGDMRATAYAPDVVRMLTALEIWQNLSAVASPVKGMKIADPEPGTAVRIPLLHLEQPEDKDAILAWMIENQKLFKVLGAQLKSSDVEVYASTTVLGYKDCGAYAELNTREHGALKTDLIVAADGRNSVLRRVAGIPTLNHDYYQTAIVGTIAHENDHEHIAWQYFRPQGPLALLPLNGKRSSIVWSQPPAAAQNLIQGDQTLAELALEDEIGGRLGTVEFLTKVVGYPLTLQIARRLNAQRLVLIGDAGHAIHPLAGQGLNLGLKDAAHLIDLMAEAVGLGLAPSEASMLEKFERRRRVEVTRMALATGGLNTLFSNNFAPIRGVRDFGLRVVDRLPGLKQNLMREAMGDNPQAPSLLRGILPG